MSSVGFGLSPAVGRGISELVLHGRCLFADLSALSLGRFADTPADWRERLGWTPAETPAVESAATAPTA
jgi:sarcosine oxidase subunit beta